MPVQVYGTVGAGVYREHWDFSDGIGLPERTSTGWARTSAEA